tara:strand:+ start:20 stop:322 length:303 start_codon:yes stop_codon:yes gene_type:complete
MPLFKAYWQYADKDPTVALEIVAEDIEEATVYARRHLSGCRDRAWVLVPDGASPPIAHEQRKDLLERMLKGEAYVRGKRRRKFYEENDNKGLLEQIAKKL